MSASNDSGYDSISRMGELYDLASPYAKRSDAAFYFQMRWYGPFEIGHLLERCGFGVTAVYGNFDRSELTDNSPEMIFVAERR